MLHKKKNLANASSGATSTPAVAAPSVSAPDTGSGAPQAAAPGASTATAPARAVSRPGPAEAGREKSGPGRPATRPHCLRCSKRLERCKCKDGALLPGQVERAVAEARKRETVPLDREEAEQILRFLCWGLGVAESAAAAALTKLTWDEAEEFFSFSEADIAALLPPAHKVLAKYAAKLPSWIRDYRDEFALALAFYAVEKQKGARASEFLERKSAKLPGARPQLVPAHAPTKPASEPPAAPAANPATMESIASEPPAETRGEEQAAVAP